MNRETRIEADRAAALAAPCSRVGVALAALGMLLLCGLPAAADTPRNERPFDGVWLAFSGGAGASPAWPTDKYTPAAKAAIAAFEDKYGPDAPEAGAFCVHAGMPSMMTSFAGYPIEILTGERQMNMITETGNFRRIFLDGRAHPTDRPPTSSGHSVGRWEGETLVIETTGLAERLQSRQLSAQARIVERLYLIDDKEGVPSGGIAASMQTERGGKILVDEITVIDPTFYTEPLKFVAHYRRAPDTAILEYDCGKEFWDEALEKLARERGKE